jgi:hypothetical protein
VERAAHTKGKTGIANQCSVNFFPLARCRQFSSFLLLLYYVEKLRNTVNVHLLFYICKNGQNDNFLLITGLLRSKMTERIYREQRGKPVCLLDFSNP